MKKLILAVALMMSAPAMAATQQEWCAEVSNLARSIMSSRHSGVPIVNQLSITKGHEQEDMATAMILEAYSKTRWHTKASQQRAITEFANDVYLICDKS